MFKKRFNVFSEIRSRAALSSIILVTNAFVWYYVVLLFLQETVKVSSYDSVVSTIIWGAHFGGLITAALIGAWLAKKVDRRRLVTVWMILGTISTVALIAASSLDPVIVILIGLLLGTSLGFGMPACMSQYKDAVQVEKRGRISGITIFVSGFGIIMFSILGISDPYILGGVLMIWRFSGLLLFLFLKFPELTKLQETAVSYKQIVSQRPFLLYFVPWVMFSLINYLVAPVIANVGSGDSVGLTIVQTGFLGMSAIVGGFFVDSTGRKRVAVVGFTLLGLGTAVLGISNTSLPILYFNAIVDGIAWGLLIVLFILTIWGDLSHGLRSDKFYAIGVAPFFVSKFLDLTVGSYLIEKLNSSALFSFGAFFLFLAVLPLVYAPETLPEKIMKDRELKSYVEKAKEKVQKESDKTRETEATSQMESDKQELETQPAENDREYEKAEQLAEKYY